MCDASKCFLSSSFLSNNDFRPGRVFDDACVAFIWYNFELFTGYYHKNLGILMACSIELDTVIH